MPQDPRIPVTLIAQFPDAAALRGGPPAALLLESCGPEVAAGALPRASFAAAAAPHAFACACCQGRSAAAQALDRLFQQRARSQVPWFERVVAVVPGAAAQAMLRDALAADLLTRARYREG